MLKKIVSAVVLLGLIAAGVLIYRSMNQVEPGEALNTALQKTAEAKSFRYAITQNLTVDGGSKLWADVNGEKNGDNVHIKGTMYGSETDIYLIGDILYQKDPFAKKWMTFKGGLPAAQQVFMIELNPLTAFNFKDLGEVTYLGKEKMNDKKTMAFQLKPNIQNQLMETLWTDFSYKIYVDTGSDFIVKGVLQARSKVKSDNILSMTVDFKDFGQGIEIKAPTQ